MLDKVVIRWRASKKLMMQELSRDGSTDSSIDRELEVKLSELEPTQRDQLLVLSNMNQFRSSRSFIWVETRQRMQFVDKENPSLIVGYAPKDFLKSIDFEMDVPMTVEWLLENWPAIFKGNQSAEEDARDRAREVNQAKKDKEEAEGAARLAEYQRMDAIYRKLLPEVEKLVAGEDIEAIKAFRSGWPDGYNCNFPSTHNSLDKMLYERVKSIEAEAETAEIRNWIAAYGSDHLKRAFAKGFEVGRIYVLERAKVEAGPHGFDVDYYDEAEWGVRFNPTEHELDVLEETEKLGLGECSLVWLKRDWCNSPDPDVREYNSYFDECAAVVISGYLGKYFLIQKVVS